MKLILSLTLTAVLLVAQTVTQNSNTSIVATVGTLECDYSGVPSQVPLTIHTSCMLSGMPLRSDDVTFITNSNSSSEFGNAGPSTGTIGWMFSPLTGGGVSFQVSASSGTPIVLAGNFLLPVSPPVITSLLSQSAVVGVPFSYQITATNNPTSYSAVGLPSGLLLNTSTGLISGIPSTAGIHPVTIGATNAGGAGTATLLLTVSAPAPPPTQITRVQTKSSFGNYSSTITIQPTAPTTTGNSVIVLVSCYYSGTSNAGAWSVSDGTNTYSSVALLVPPSQQVQAFLASNVTGTAHAITVTSTVPTYWVATMLEYSGLGALDKFAQAFDGNLTYASGPLSTAQANELLLATVHYNNSNTASATPDAPWTEVLGTNDGAYQSQIVQEQIVGALGTYNASGHLASAMPHSTVLLAIKGQ